MPLVLYDTKGASLAGISLQGSTPADIIPIAFRPDSVLCRNTATSITTDIWGGRYGKTFSAPLTYASILSTSDSYVNSGGDGTIGFSQGMLTPIMNDSGSTEFGWVNEFKATSASNYNIGTNDFTFEYWVYVKPTDLNVYQAEDTSGAGGPNATQYKQMASEAYIFNTDPDGYPQNGVGMSIVDVESSSFYPYIVKCASTGNVDALNLRPNMVIDGHSLNDGDLVLLKNQTNSLENGIYSVHNTGTVTPYSTGAATIYARRIYYGAGLITSNIADPWGGADGSKNARMKVLVESGTTNALTAWEQSTNTPRIGPRVKIISNTNFTGNFTLTEAVCTGGTGKGMIVELVNAEYSTISIVGPCTEMSIVYPGAGYTVGDTLTAVGTNVSGGSDGHVVFQILEFGSGSLQYTQGEIPHGPKEYISDIFGSWTGAVQNTAFKVNLRLYWNTGFNSSAIPTDFTPGTDFTGNLAPYYGVQKADTVHVAESSLSFSGNSWHHIAVSRQGTAVIVFIDGIISDRYTIPLNANIKTNGDSINLGSYETAVTSKVYSALPIFISDFRFTLSAVYTSEFTPPSEALTDDANTKLHLRYSDPGAGEVMQLYKDGVLLGNITKLDISGSGLDVSITSDEGIVVGNALMLQYNGANLGAARTLNVTSPGGAVTSSISGTIGEISNSAAIWIGTWSSGVSYEINDVVTIGPALFTCTAAHTSDGSNQPQISSSTTVTTWSSYWAAMVDGSGLSTAPPGFLDTALDWAKNATIGDWAQALIIGGIVGIAGSNVLNAMAGNGSSSTASSTYNGSTTFSGTYTPPSLRQVAESLCIEAGIPSYDVSLLSDTISCSFSLSQITSNRTVMDNFAKAFQFDMVDSSGVLKFIPRNSTSVRTLTNDDLGFNIQGQSIAPVTKKRMQSIDLPKSIALTYIAEDLDYNQFTQISELTTFADGQDVTLTVPFSMTHQQAKDATDQLLIGAHLERQQYIFKTNYQYAVDLEPGDIITIPEGNVRIIAIEEQDEGVLQITSVDAGYTGAAQPIIVGGVTIGYTAASYVGTGAAAAIPAVVINAAKQVSTSGVFFIDPPVLDSADTAPRAFAAIHGYGNPNWSGAQIFRSTDGGASYALIGTQTTEAIWGMVATPVADHPSQYWDDTTVITVQVKTGSLNSATDIAVLAGANLCMIGTEVLHFGVATLISAGTYQLTHLLRGRRGTEWATSTHVANELFVMIDGNILELPVSDSQRGATYDYKVVSIGSDLTKVDPISMQIIGNNLTPWTVSQLKSSKDSSGIWNTSWIERPRFVNSLQDYFEIPHDPDWGGWAVFIYNGSTVVRQQIVYTTAFAYPPSLQIADFGSLRTSLKIGVTQISNKYGGGHQTIITV
jgi:hypothetical protein